MVEEIKKRYLSDEGIAWVTEVIRLFNHKAAMPASEDEQATRLKLIDQLERRILRMKEAYLDGIIELDEFKREKPKLETELTAQKDSLVEAVDVEKPTLPQIIRITSVAPPP